MNLCRRAFISHLPEYVSERFFFDFDYASPLSVYAYLGHCATGLCIVITFQLPISLTYRCSDAAAFGQVFPPTPCSVLGNRSPPSTFSRDGPSHERHGARLGDASSALSKDAERNPRPPRSETGTPWHTGAPHHKYPQGHPVQDVQAVSTGTRCSRSKYIGHEMKA